MKKFTTAVLMGVVLSLGVFASIASAGNGNGNGSMDRGGTNTCQPSFHDEGGTCVHNGDAAGNCGQNQSGDTGNGNGSNEGNGGDKGYGTRPGCDAPASAPPPPPPPAITPAPSAAPGSTPPAAPEAPAAPASTPVAPATNQAPATDGQRAVQRASFKPPAVKHKPKKALKRHAVKGVKTLLATAKAPRKAPFTK